MSQKWKSVETGAIGGTARVELKDGLGLTGCEATINRLAAGQAVPFVHHHRNNEEVYVVLSGSGEFWLDGEAVPVREGSCVRVSPETPRCMRASPSTGLVYLCVQAEAGSLRGYTATDGVIDEGVKAW